MTVEQAVLGVLIANYPVVRNHVVQTAHPTYQMSGLARLRQLKQEGIVSYRYDSRTHVYRIQTPVDELRRALGAMERGEKDPMKIVAAMRGFKCPSAGSASSPQAGSERTETPPAQHAPHPHPAPPLEREGRKKEEEAPPFSFDLAKLREFRESL